jgi:glycosyltransferase involved in cell wall biosynthesis
MIKLPINFKSIFGSGSGRTLSGRSAFIPFDSRTSIGGPATFLRNLKGYLDRTGFPYAANLKQASVILFPVSHDLKQLRKFKKRGGKVCQRLDGIYYPEKHGEEHVERNAKIKEIYLNLADHVVFQSDYSRVQCFDMFGPVPPEAYSIIINGANTEIFYPDTTRRFNKENIQLCTTGNIRNDDMLVPVIQALDLIRSKYNFTFHVVGPVKNSRCAEFMQREYVVHHGSCGLQQVAEALRAADIFIYSHLNPPCPNSVLEAAASGLPVTGYNSGSLAELLPFSADLLADAGAKIYHRLEDFRPEALAEKIVFLIEHYEQYRAMSLQSSGSYSMDNCGAKYVSVLEALMK